jgi:arginyl-tRNA synthetase
MMLFEPELRVAVEEAMQHLYNIQVDPSDIAINETRKDFEGDITVVVFNLAKLARKRPDELGKELGNSLLEHCGEVSGFNVVNGFLNVVIKTEAWLNVYTESANDSHFGYVEVAPNMNSHPVIVEYSSPNTNKPLHLGHIRNNLIGYSVARLLKATGNPVKTVSLINDRGIHICKSMLAWMKSANGESPESSGMKGDHLVGKYYVEFDKLYKTEIAGLREKGLTEEDAARQAPVMLEAQALLVKWEANDPDTVALWEKMNSWVYKGFDSTYKMLGVAFDKLYYESEMYLVGKQKVEEGLAKGVFYKKDDGSIWVDLTEDGLDHKLLLRGDGTSVYITSDIGTAILRYEESKFSRLLYVVGNEQDYHFKVLRVIMKKLGYDWWQDLHHLAYAMVDLPSGKMKSREGTVVDADDLMEEMIAEAKKITIELGKIEDFESKEAEALYKMIGLGALKYYILKVDPGKRMLFNPAESIDFNGHTGPFIQYTYARIRSVLRKGEKQKELSEYLHFNPVHYSGSNVKERELIKLVLNYPYVLADAAENFSPAVVANYAYEVAKLFNQFYHENAIIDIDNIETSKFRMHISHQCARVIKMALGLLGIDVPERM